MPFGGSKKPVYAGMDVFPLHISHDVHLSARGTFFANSLRDRRATPPKKGAAHTTALAAYFLLGKVGTLRFLLIADEGWLPILGVVEPKPFRESNVGWLLMLGLVVFRPFRISDVGR
jgi:hypothetical protein